jgi:two-component system, OmpR family, sensor histidine kinase MprB
MSRMTLVGRLTIAHALVMSIACALLVAGTMASAALVLRLDQDRSLTEMATTLCSMVSHEEAENDLGDIASAHEAFTEGYRDGYRFEYLGGSGSLLLGLGELAGWDSGWPAGSGSGCRSHRASEASAGAVYRECARACAPDRSMRVGEQDALSQPAVRRAVMLIVGSLPLAVALLVGVGAALFRRQLTPLASLQRAADTLEARSGIALGVGAAPTELARLEQAFDRLLARLGEALVREQRFTQEASHELRTPLTVMRGRVELLRDALQDDPALRAEAEAVLRDITSLDDLVEDLLILARSESAHLPSMPVNLCDLAREAATRARRAGRDACRPVEIDAPDEILVTGSEELLKRAIENVVENSRKYAGPQARVRIRVFVEDGSGVVSIGDDGPGIPGELRARVFDRFVRGPATRGEIPGTGLGLAVVRAIAMRHGGGVTTGPADLGGEEVRIVLPLEDTRAA